MCINIFHTDLQNVLCEYFVEILKKNPGFAESSGFDQYFLLYLKKFLWEIPALPRGKDIPKFGPLSIQGWVRTQNEILH